MCGMTLKLCKVPDGNNVRLQMYCLFKVPNLLEKGFLLNKRLNVNKFLIRQRDFYEQKR